MKREEIWLYSIDYPPHGFINHIWWLKKNYNKDMILKTMILESREGNTIQMEVRFAHSHKMVKCWYE